ncbi:sugar ABC transporter permease [Streptococcus cuniculi]|uniref:Maltose/maltodextrin transport system permease protein n=1 Tax=Streptococcus cuniculi TaxID=1432788 RepID=A0A1Q8E7F5_9STRE|nr:sugar ABC transporter permease [Streptococcus cuniculi]OLF47739.1 sugar ABC transporter permease [Streptococcus cuniculi]
MKRVKINPKWTNFLRNATIGEKLSFLVMGSAHLHNRQFVKGLLYIVTQVFFVYWFITRGIPAMIGLVTLGTETQGWKFDEELGINVKVAGDNSMLFLIYGIATLVLLGIFFVIYIRNIKEAQELYFKRVHQEHIPNIKEELASLLNEKFHVTLMGFPILGILIFTVIPLFYMILLAFTNFDHNHLPPKSLFDWVGISNFGSILNGRISNTFFPVFTWTLIWAFFATVTSFFFGVLLAIWINSKNIKGKKVYRTLFVLTMAVPQFISLLIMQNMFHASGPINAYLMNLHLISAPIPFLTDAVMAKIFVILINMWVGIPATMLVSTGIIINLPTEQLEAATIDGASKFQIFRYITFPQILFVMAPSLIQQFIGNINNFNVIYLLTGGGPLNSDFYGAGETDLLVTWLYKLTVEVADYNLASVIGIIIFVLSAVVSLIAYNKVNAYQRQGG